MDRSRTTLLRRMQRIEIKHGAAPASAPNCLVQDNTREPGSQTGRAAKIAQTGERPDVGLLYRVFRFMILRQHASRDAVQVLVMTSDECAERAGIPLPGAFEQLTVAGSGHVSTLHAPLDRLGEAPRLQRSSLPRVSGTFGHNDGSNAFDGGQPRPP